MSVVEAELKNLMIAGLDGDAAAHRCLLEKLARHLRGYYKGRLARIGRSATEAEDLVQEALLAIHTQRHTYEPTELLTPWVHAIAPSSPSISRPCATSSGAFRWPWRTTPCSLPTIDRPACPTRSSSMPG